MKDVGDEKGDQSNRGNQQQGVAKPLSPPSAFSEPDQEQSQNQQTKSDRLEQTTLKPPVEAVRQEEAVAAEAAAHSCDHSFCAAFGNRDFSGDGVVLVQNAGSISHGNSRILTGVG